MTWTMAVCLKLAAILHVSGCVDAPADMKTAGVVSETDFDIAEENDAAIVQCGTTACQKMMRSTPSAKFIVIEMPRHRAFVLLRPDLGDSQLGRYVIWGRALDRID